MRAMGIAYRHSPCSDGAHKDLASRSVTPGRLPSVTMNKPFEQAVQEHAATVLRVCRAVLIDMTDAEDAWSETFLAALRAWPELPASTNVEAWLVRVAHRKAIDVVWARARHALPVSDPPEPAVHADGPERSQENSALWAEVAALPERQRQAIAYHYFGGLPHTETAELIGSTPAAVRRAAADGLAALRRHRSDLDASGA